MQHRSNLLCLNILQYKGLIKCGYEMNDIWKSSIEQRFLAKKMVERLMHIILSLSLFLPLLPKSFTLS